MKDHEKDDRFLAAQVEKVESLGDAKAKKWGAFPWHTRTIPIWEYPPPPTDTHTNPGGGLAGNIKGFSARTHLNMGHLFLFTPPLQCKLRL